eukprot:CAMPEP_0179145832 /NCGR_PEP_ID=MMETSP0796-20121207/70386_1 /TAXON_ID=73915 /ORGANISM="Pyrodinium bahamense, Strain pbaha01" /LENGTH=33 /DNA_ID= /DNA_START= /DNA_END= /DNA_ORIENTATION=
MQARSLPSITAPRNSSSVNNSSSSGNLPIPFWA